MSLVYVKLKSGSWCFGIFYNSNYVSVIYVK